ncbi:unnamed protein product [Caenorhabditis bovis]|uniref:EH domain-containing protein n=1 Tax=Caenorhabditis bovis TaxID=2654633 RepID=A0A8S1EJR8_9PELO|nr:unnamed protein product [Caenorhabditis bovis]
MDPKKTFSMDSQILEEVIRSGNIPCHGRSGMLCSGGGLLPPALLNESKVPKFYLDAIAACGATTSSALPNTALVYNLMVSSNLPKDVLSYIWSAVNRTKPGQLTRPEFFSCIALIALAQKGESLAALCAMDSLPIPFLNPVQAVPASTNATTTASSSSFVPFARIKQTTSAFIPTSLLPRKSLRKKKEADLIGEPTAAASSASPTKSATKDLMGLDLFVESANGEDGENAESSTIHCWRETVHAVFLVFQEANGILGKTPKSVLDEIFSTEKGENYLRSLRRAFITLERVCKSAGVLLPAKSTNEAEACRKCWQRLSPFLTVHDVDEAAKDERKCGICCQPVSTPVDYGGQCYDVTCANLWVNNVSSMLPNQHLKH